LGLRTQYLLFLGLRTPYFHWVYAPFFLLFWVYAPAIFIGFYVPVIFHWAYAPDIFSLGFTHPLSSLGLRTQYLLFLGLRTPYFHWVYAPFSSILGLRTRYFHWVLRTRYFSLGLRTRYFSLVYAPVIFAGLRTPYFIGLRTRYRHWAYALVIFYFISFWVFTHPLPSFFGGFIHPTSSTRVFYVPSITFWFTMCYFIRDHHPLFIWVYAPVILIGSCTCHRYLGFHAPVYLLFWVHTPVIFCFLVFTHPTSSVGYVYFQFTIGFTTRYLMRDYHPSFIGFTCLLRCSLSLLGFSRTHHPLFGFMHRHLLVIYAPHISAWLYLPSFRRSGLPLLIIRDYALSFNWDITHYLSGLRTRYPLCEFMYTLSFIYITHPISIWMYAFTIPLFGLTHLLFYVNWFTHLTSLSKFLCTLDLPFSADHLSFYLGLPFALLFAFTCPLPFYGVYMPVTFFIHACVPIIIYLVHTPFIISYLMWFSTILLSFVWGYTPYLFHLCSRAPNLPLFLYTRSFIYSVYHLPFYLGSPPAVLSPSPCGNN
jgi:hypothetical protein